MLSENDKREIKQSILSNQHEIFVVSIDEMDAIVESSSKANVAYVKGAWQKIKDKAEFSAGYYASADDLRTLIKLVTDLGGFATRAYVKNYGGKPHIILKGHPGLRRILTGTKYGIKNPKVITMGLGKAGAIHAAKSGGIISVVLLSAYRVVDYILTDQTTLSQFIGSLATDVIKVGIATGASIAAASAVAGMGFTIAIGPIAAVVLVGVLTSIALSVLDEHYGITDRVIAGLDDIGDSIEGGVDQLKRKLYHRVDDLVDTILDYAIESATAVLIDVARNTADRFITGRPRLR